MKRLVPALILASTVALTAALQPTGFYYDNGYNQTEFEFLNPEDRELVGEEILNLLGLGRVPETKNKKLKQKDKDKEFHLRAQENHTIPAFMQDIYQSLTEKDGVLKSLFTEEEMNLLLSNPFHITRTNIRMINTSDIIMSFPNRDLQEESKWTPLFWFDTSELPDSVDTEILMADLRIFKDPVEPIDGKADTQFYLRAYRIGDELIETTHLLDSKVINHSTQGWIVLNVSAALRHWQHEQATNQGLMVEVTEVTSSNQVHPVALGLVTGKQTTTEKESFLVTYLRSTVDMVRVRYNRIRRLSSHDHDQDLDLEESVSSSRRKRDLKLRRKKNRRNRDRSNNPNLHLLDVFKFGKNNRNLFGRQDPTQGNCQRHMLRVNFQDFNWQDWIISPREYEKYYCKGNCIFPLNSNTHPTSHAILQAFAHSLDPELIPMPCCAPTKLSGLSVLYFDESSNVVLKKYKNMIVRSCGCQ